MRGYGKTLLVVCAALALVGTDARRSLRQATSASTCPVDSTAVTLDFTEVKTACVPTNTTNGPAPRAFCDACTCALFTAFAPALRASGVSSTSNATSMARGVDVVSSCVNAFLGQFVSAQVDVQALIELSTCEYQANEVPACLSGRVAAMAANITQTTTNTTTAFRSTTNTTESPAVSATSGRQDYADDDDASTEISNAIGGVGSPATTSPTTTAPATSPSTTTPVTTTPGVIPVQQPVMTPTASPVTDNNAAPATEAPGTTTTTPTETTLTPTTSPVIATPVATPAAAPASSASLVSMTASHVMGVIMASSMLLAMLA